jgi:hypothetical protein
MVLRPRHSASAINSRYGSQALSARRVRPGGEGGRHRSLDTVHAWWLVLQTASRVDTSVVVADFGGQARGRPTRPPPHTATAATLR